MSWDVLWAPWRYRYVAEVSSSKQRRGGCLFCDMISKADEEALILYRGSKGFVVMNLYPYNTGHVMVVPYRHVPSLEDLDDEEALELMKLVSLSIKCLRKALSPDGFNVGVNIGKIAGAGVEDHVHIHVVPRWSGDTNFMPVLAKVKVVPQDVRETYALLKPVFEQESKSLNLARA